ncbi:MULTISPECIES: diguanylate cyclase [unclassified Motilimonas]|uniref:diguanylate cyclase domain-containing protein n=1 Tax=Motilimonas TaxID=1914248 RepID=UPI001E4E9BCC|nr:MULTISPECIES: diguanylate cyclase [unclassified Motilimonas]MDO6526010.1 diguanylate cyclase [Motilimonas sp. 1_MG-2023]
MSTDTRNRILIVDDEKVNISILVELLKDRYDTVVAKNGEQALRRVLEHKPDLILLDIVMPGMNGFQVCKALKSNPETADIPVIFITAKDSENDEEEGLSVGAIDYVTKPFSSAIIRARVHNHLELKRRGDLLKALSTIDPLTEIANRRRLDEFLTFQWQQLKRSGGMLAILLLDIDYFKAFNDHYGHQQGDECLVHVAHTLSSLPLRNVDLVARYGGEEFVIVLALTELSAIEKVALSVQQALQEHPVKHGYSLVAPYVTVSIGGASIYPSQGGSVALLFNQADAALYQAKDQGRNRFVLADFQDER